MKYLFMVILFTIQYYTHTLNNNKTNMQSVDAVKSKNDLISANLTI